MQLFAELFFFIIEAILEGISSRIPVKVYAGIILLAVAFLIGVAVFSPDKPSTTPPVSAHKPPAALVPPAKSVSMAAQQDNKTFSQGSKANGNYLTTNFVNHQGRIYLCSDSLAPCKGDPSDPASLWVPMSDAFFAWYYDTPKVSYIDYQIGSGNLYASDKSASKKPEQDKTYLSVNLLFSAPPK